jgi:hypothetical protein
MMSRLAPVAVGVVFSAVVASGVSSRTPARHQEAKDTRMEISEAAFDELLREFDQRSDVDALRKALPLVESAGAGVPASKTDVLTVRRDKLRLFLTVFNSIDAKVIPGFDFADLPSISSDPPAGLRSGISPSSIADSELRAQYEQTIAADQAKRAVYTFQSKLKKMDARWMDAFAAFVSAQFPMSARESLSEDVATSIKSDARRVALQERIRAAFH